MRLSSQRKDVTQTSVEEPLDDCKLKNTYYWFLQSYNLLVVCNKLTPSVTILATSFLLRSLHQHRPNRRDRSILPDRTGRYAGTGWRERFDTTQRSAYDGCYLGGRQSY